MYFDAILALVVSFYCFLIMEQMLFCLIDKSKFASAQGVSFKPQSHSYMRHYGL